MTRDAVDSIRAFIPSSFLRKTGSEEKLLPFFLLASLRGTWSMNFGEVCSLFNESTRSFNLLLFFFHSWSNASDFVAYLLPVCCKVFMSEFWCLSGEVDIFVEKFSTVRTEDQKNTLQGLTFFIADQVLLCRSSPFNDHKRLNMHLSMKLYNWTE